MCLASPIYRIAALLVVLFSTLSPTTGVADEGPAAAPPNAALPAFLKAGTRLVFEQGQSTIYGIRTIRTPQGGFAWKDQRGQLWNTGDRRNAGGVGYAVLDIVHADADTVAIDQTSFLRLFDGSTQLGPRSAVIAKPADGLAIYWKSPALLQQLPQGADATGRTTVRIKHTVDGKPIDAVSILLETESNYFSQIWDLQTGLLLQANTGTYTEVVGQFGPERVAILGHQQLKGVRELKLPWANDAMPPWLTLNRKFVWNGGQSLLIPQGMPLNTPGMLSLEVTAVAPKWAQAKGLTRLQGAFGGPPIDSPSERVLGSATLMGLWVSPKAIGQLKPNTVIDEDPVTKTRVTFAGVQGKVAVFVQQGPADQVHHAYDAESGMLVGIQKVQNQGVGQTREQYQIAPAP